MTQLSAHFTLEELTVTDTGLDNTPSGADVDRLYTLAEFLEKVRTACGNHPVLIDSAFRSAKVNAAVGGVPDSAHAEAYAADIRIPEYGTPYEVAVQLSFAQSQGHIEFDQLIYEGTWVHISRDPQLRNERLTLVATGAYADGIIRA